MMGHGAVSLWSLVGVLLFIVVPLWLYARILGKAGYSGWWAILGLVPLVNVIMIWVFAFADWPSLRREE
ncbi:MAG: hypothetical protein PVH31_05700 [Ectothiorhodospiraceae bacterium]|jgi:uncharacterized membrane protein YhaH (DUF805 family)